jgi:hypothetical protein
MNYTLRYQWFIFRVIYQFSTEHPYISAVFEKIGLLGKVRFALDQYECYLN